ncbi:TetR/AcrR family transcriptional regulator [Tranquillimonas rosea]|nr:TetR/AcrR family transcriptional regulator [Tranquillimonas rosea]
MDSSSQRAKRGRPVAICVAERRELILDALDEVFREAGMRGTTMAAVARKAGMSKRTLYEIFDDRAALFQAYMDRLRTAIARPLDDAAVDLPLEQRLRLLLAPRRPDSPPDLPIAILRALVAESPERPEMGRTFMSRGPHAVEEMIRQELERAVGRGEIRIADTGAAATLLKDMLRASPLDLLIDPDADPCDRDVEARFELALKVFLNGIEAAQNDG